MPPVDQNLPLLQKVRGTESRLVLDQERASVRAKELQRRKQILLNELGASGATESEREYLNQRIQSLSNEEDVLAQKIAATERQLSETRRQLSEIDQQIITTEQQRQNVLGTRARRQILRGQTGDPAKQQERLRRAALLYARRQTEREEQFARLKSQARKAFFLIGVFGLLIAGVADLLSIFDAGWVVSWLIPIITWFIARRITSMNNSISLIREAQGRAKDELRLMIRRLRPALVRTGNMQLFVQAETLEVSQRVRSYITTFVRDEITAQLLEFIPVLDWLPMYLGIVVKILIDQRRTHRQVRDALIPYRQTLDLLAELERFEIRQASEEIGISLRSPATTLVPTH